MSDKFDVRLEFWRKWWGGNKDKDKEPEPKKKATKKKSTTKKKKSTKKTAKKKSTAKKKTSPKKKVAKAPKKKTLKFRLQGTLTIADIQHQLNFEYKDSARGVYFLNMIDNMTKWKRQNRSLTPVVVWTKDEGEGTYPTQADIEFYNGESDNKPKHKVDISTLHRYEIISSEELNTELESDDIYEHVQSGGKSIFESRLEEHNFIPYD